MNQDHKWISASQQPELVGFYWVARQNSKEVELGWWFDLGGWYDGYDFGDEDSIGISDVILWADIKEPDFPKELINELD